MIAVVDHGAGNLVSIAQGLRRTGAEISIVDNPSDMERADGVVLPGVGRTGAAMARLAATGLDDALRAWDRPLLGICVGLQLFFDRSEEDDGPGLGLLRGTVRRLDAAPLLPHIGWNDVELGDDPIFAGVQDAVFYFVHSYAPEPADDETTIARSAYGRPFAAAVRDGRRVGVQFHPERSGRDGLRILANFVDEVRRAS